MIAFEVSALTRGAYLILCHAEHRNEILFRSRNLKDLHEIVAILAVAISRAHQEIALGWPMERIARRSPIWQADLDHRGAARQTSYAVWELHPFDDAQDRIVAEFANRSVTIALRDALRRVLTLEIRRILREEISSASPAHYPALLDGGEPIARPLKYAGGSTPQQKSRLVKRRTRLQH